MTALGPQYPTAGGRGVGGPVRVFDTLLFFVAIKIVSLLFILLFGCVLQDNFVVSMYLYSKFTDSDQ